MRYLEYRLHWLAFVTAIAGAAGCSTIDTTKRTGVVTDVRYVEPRQDVAWENDRIAFRMYGPALAAEVSNGVDVWSKRVPYPIVASWYEGDTATGPAKRSYHTDHGEGADFFAVGRTLGCGGSSIRDGDSLMQPGVFRSYRILSTGSTKAEFELTYAPVIYRGRSVRETRRVTLVAGAHMNRFDVTYESDGEPIDIPFAIGLVKRAGVVATRHPAEHAISLWGPTNNDPVNGELGMGALLPGGAFRSIQENATHLLIYGEVPSGVTVTYYAGAGWTRSGSPSDQADWASIVAKAADSADYGPE